MSVDRDPQVGDKFRWQLGAGASAGAAVVLAVADGAVLFRYEDGFVSGCTVAEWRRSATLVKHFDAEAQP